MATDIRFLSLNRKYLLRDRVVKSELIAIIFLVFISVVLMLLKIFPMSDDYETKVHENSVLLGMIDEKKKLGSLVKEYGKTAPVVEVIEEKLSSTFSQAELTRKFNTLARENGVEVLSMNTKNGETYTGYRSYINEVAFKGTYPSVKKLVLSFESLPGFNSISEIGLYKESSTRFVNGTLVLVTAKEAR